MFDNLVNACSIVYSDNSTSITTNILGRIHRDSPGYIITNSESFDHYSNEFPNSTITTYTDAAELVKYGCSDEIKYILFDYNGSISGYNNIIKSIVNIKNKTCIIVQHKLYSYNKSVSDSIDNFIIDSVNVNYGRIYNNFMDLKHRYDFDEFVDLCDKNLVIIDWSNINTIKDSIEVCKSNHSIVYQSMIMEEPIITEEQEGQEGQEGQEEVKIEENTSRCSIL